MNDFERFEEIPKKLSNLVNFANNCEIFEYICQTAETVSEFGREAFKKKRIVV